MSYPVVQGGVSNMLRVVPVRQNHSVLATRKGSGWLAVNPANVHYNSEARINKCSVGAMKNSGQGCLNGQTI